ncbi:glycosyltransferase family 4 protein [Paenibacillus glycanilyticus]|uniref:glycosyltransferase family 4 protein n=1 Tax=Paenibacillus glycanilyticus TaxID=126569 RepID=UPI00203E0156|nr:glycosyltransferase family 4 protein [Paenibacillus glycanilyticus]MCM3630339.1 glycosyltransferase family 4 protein [Paenibacillus glycanilyticus]
MSRAEKNDINVLMVGSDVSVKGGMTTVVESFLNCKFDNVKIKYVATHIESNKINKALFFMKSIIIIMFLVAFTKISLIHIHMSERGSFKRKNIIFRIGKLFRKKIILHMHGAEFEEYYYNCNPTVQYKIRRLLRETDYIIALGERWKDIIKKIELKSNVEILRNAVDIPDRVNEIQNLNNINVLFLAVLTKRKGIIDLIYASEKLMKRINQQNKIIHFIVSGDGELESEAKALVNQLKITNNYTFTGWISGSQKHALLRKTDIFVLPSYNEGLPVSILEAISYGIPVVSTRVGSIDEAVKDGVNGYLISPGNQDELIDSLERIINDPQFKKLGEKSREIAEKSFNSNEYFKEVSNLYESL